MGGRRASQAVRHGKHVDAPAKASLSRRRRLKSTNVAVGVITLVVTFAVTGDNHTEEGDALGKPAAAALWNVIAIGASSHDLPGIARRVVVRPTVRHRLV
ncbi:hypothetical protein MTO96_042519 [Rhipicephalus appendiculatus]